jgi:hypothetical protein
MSGANEIEIRGHPSEEETLAVEAALRVAGPDRADERYRQWRAQRQSVLRPAPATRGH